MSSQIVPAVGSQLHRFFSFGSNPNPPPEIRLYQCVKKESKEFSCVEMRAGDGMLVLPAAKLISIPSYIPKPLDRVILWAKYTF